MKGYEDLVKLLKHVQTTHGIDCDEASICEYQDMIGHSSDEQLTDLANGVYKETFYKVYGLAYGTVEAIKFFIHHGEKVNALVMENANLKCDIEDAKNDIKKAKAEAEKYSELMTKARDAWEEEKKKVDATQKELDEAHNEIIQLKAKLYDLMQK